MKVSVPRARINLVEQSIPCKIVSSDRLLRIASFTARDAPFYPWTWTQTHTPDRMVRISITYVRYGWMTDKGRFWIMWLSNSNPSTREVLRVQRDLKMLNNCCTRFSTRNKSTFFWRYTLRRNTRAVWFDFSLHTWSLKTIGNKSKKTWLVPFEREYNIYKMIGRTNFEPIQRVGRYTAYIQ